MAYWTRLLKPELAVLVLGYRRCKIREFPLDEVPSSRNDVRCDRPLYLKCQGKIHGAANLLPEPEEDEL